MNVINFDEKRVSVMVSAIQSILPKLQDIGPFTIKEALTLAGWPDNLNISRDFSEQIQRLAVQEKILLPKKDKFEVNPDAKKNAQDSMENFLRKRTRFILSLTLRIRNKFPNLHDEAEKIANDIDASLITYFKEGGLTLASTLFSKDKNNNNIPPSIIKFIQEASSQYEDILLRQAFFTTSVDSFVKAGDAERDYLGRIAQGYFAFHMLGAFGSVVAERLLDAENTIWLLDSSLQIHALALASSLNLVFKDCFSRLRKLGIRLFTTKKLFDEVIDHLWFANRIITEYGQNSYHVIAAARNDAPYPKSNVFLEGYIRWHALGKTNEWESYLYQIFGITNLFENKHLTEEELIKIQVV